MDSKYLSPLVNLGNIFYLNEDASGALSWYKKAEQLDPHNAAVVASVARTQYELENFQQAEEAYYKLKTIEPALAVEYAYLSTESNYVGRAAAANDRGATFWSEE